MLTLMPSTLAQIAGSRSGGLIAQCWASMVTMGEQGYINHAVDIIETTRAMAQGIRKIDGIKLLGDAEAMIVCIGGTEGVNAHAVGDQMSKLGGWALSSHQHPSCIHLCVTVCHVGKVDLFLTDLRASVEHVKNQKGKLGGNAAIYGMTSGMPSGPVNDLLKIYNDVVLSI